MGLALLGGFLAACAGANIKAILMNVNPARDRGSVFGFLSITDAIGPGLGPFVGTLFFGWFGFNGGMNFSILWWIPCALTFFAAAAFIESDRRRARSDGVFSDSTPAPLVANLNEA
jgi:MFS family permease